MIRLLFQDRSDNNDISVYSLFRIVDLNKNLESAENFANEYDKYISVRHWNGPAILFGLIYEFISCGDKLLDLGIGTGLSSKPFHIAGLRITGVDGSENMLKICKSKSITEKLVKADLSSEKLPFEHAEFNHIIAYAVFHLLGDLSLIANEVKRLIKPKGIFGFSVAHFDASKDDDFKESDIRGVFAYTNPELGVTSFRHSREYIMDLLHRRQFQVLKELSFCAFRDEGENRTVDFTIFITRSN